MHNFIEQLKRKGYSETGFVEAGLRVLYVMQAGMPYVICFIDRERLSDKSAGAYDNIEHKIRGLFERIACMSLKMIKIISTDDVAGARALLNGQQNYWLIDKVTGRLIIYENQPDDFMHIKHLLESYLYAGQQYSGQEEVHVQGMSQTAGYQNYGQEAYGNYGVPRKARDFLTVTNFIIAINVIVFIVTSMGGDVYNGRYMIECGGLIAPLEPGEYYRLFTCMFLHFGIRHLGMNMFCLYLMGNDLEKFIGKLAYIAVYIGGGLFSSILTLAYYMSADKYNTVSAGASGAVYAVIGALIVMAIRDEQVRKRFSLRGLLICVALMFLQGITDSSVNSVAHFGGLIAGFLIAFLTVTIRRNKT